jgi:hypothetical protein
MTFDRFRGRVIVSVPESRPREEFAMSGGR